MNIDREAQARIACRTNQMIPFAGTQTPQRRISLDSRPAEDKQNDFPAPWREKTALLSKRIRYDYAKPDIRRHSAP